MGLNKLVVATSTLLYSLVPQSICILILVFHCKAKYQLRVENGVGILFINVLFTDCWEFYFCRAAEKTSGI